MRGSGGGGAKGALAPPSPQNIAPPNSEARAKRALASPPYKILDPPMYIIAVCVCVCVGGGGSGQPPKKPKYATGEGGQGGGASAPGPGPVVGARAKLDFLPFFW